MKTKVYFIRHAKPDISIKNNMTRPLLSEGIEKSKELVKIFTEIKIDYIYSSPYKRAIQTIEPIAENKKIKIEIKNDFREGKMSNNWIDNYEEFIKNHWNDFSYKLTDGESLNEVQERNIKELEKILSKNTGKTVIIGTHGTALSAIINYYDKTFLYNNFMEIVNIMPYIIEIEYENNKYIKRNEIKM
jgi:2,3-bisphosphoglycerate-dependent phosphoglycerate mutase